MENGYFCVYGHLELCSYVHSWTALAARKTPDVSLQSKDCICHCEVERSHCIEVPRYTKTYQTTMKKQSDFQIFSARFVVETTQKYLFDEIFKLEILRFWCRAILHIHDIEWYTEIKGGFLINITLPNAFNTLLTSAMLGEMIVPSNSFRLNVLESTRIQHIREYTIIYETPTHNDVSIIS